MIPAWLAFFDALIAIALVLLGILGAHYGAFSSIFGFQIFLLAFFIAILGLILSVIAVLTTALSAKRRAGLPRAIVALIICLIIVVPIANIIASTHKYPPINDITTDINHAPEFVHAQQLPGNHGRDLVYDKAKYAAAQTKGYGEVEPLKLGDPPDVAFQKVEIVAGEIPHWRITYTDPKTRTLEGVATSMLFHFKDDFVIVVLPQGDQAPAGPGLSGAAANAPAASSGSLVEMRSKSRDGIGDLGVNYRRIKSFFHTLEVHQHGTEPVTVPGGPG
ncbi:MAG: DUF1499 domain-containing protein [Candidatus Binataceae bacterium]